ncbi:hypothetical protein Rleg4DRAFT_2300 [Rhizobium leguminosarum bv. trifolii WSM2297]|uniref:SH3 domain-containing protein n=1 Tax=Rhizobium leguminosarum bv. trifolii WSM2297 TaxID=754762 RepID=J0CM66_RHILT|nr:hypothetical protein Rleg4DRAFT_2300 [Rhizobium leguminosarum bv. trifolii WSM2297]
MASAFGAPAAESKKSPLPLSTLTSGTDNVPKSRMPAEVAMARRRRPKKLPKITPAVFLAVLVLGGLGSLFGRTNPTTSPALNETSTVSAAPPTVEQQETLPVGPSVGPATLQSATSPTEMQTETPLPSRLVKGSKVALRDGPRKQFGILDRYDSGREVRGLDTEGAWSHIRDSLTLRDGWISTSFLSDQQQPQTERKDQASSERKPSIPPATPAIPDTLVVQRIIAESI